MSISNPATPLVELLADAYNLSDVTISPVHAYNDAWRQICRVDGISGEILVVVGRNADGSWLQGVVLDDNLEPEILGWVSADSVFCIGEIEDAPVVEENP